METPPLTQDRSAVSGEEEEAAVSAVAILLDVKIPILLLLPLL